MGAEGLRSALVARLVDGGRIRSPSVAEAFLTVPRHLFLPDTPLERAYADEAVATKWQDGSAVSSASQPSMMAIMLEQLALRPGHRVLEIGTGTGYNAALMSRLVGPTGSVVALDIDEDLTEGAAAHLAAAGVRGVTLVTRDGAIGYPEAAPYDRIVLTVGSTDVQPAWWRQLAPGGRLLLPLSVRGSQLSVALDLAAGHELRSASVRGCAFVRLRGVGAGPEPSRPVADGLAVQAWREVPPDPLVALLGQPGADRPSPVRLTPTDLWDGVGLWLAVREPRACRLLVADSAEAHRDLSLLPEGMDGGTMALLGEQGLAALVRRGARDDTSPFPVAVRPFGPDGPACAERLAARLREWEGIGRPGASRMRLRVRPREEEPTAGPPASWATRVETAHTRLEIGWPANRVGSAPKLER